MLDAKSLVCSLASNRFTAWLQGPETDRACMLEVILSCVGHCCDVMRKQVR